MLDMIRNVVPIDAEHEDVQLPPHESTKVWERLFGQGRGVAAPRDHSGRVTANYIIWWFPCSDSSQTQSW